jgi:hypothetical protein
VTRALTIPFALAGLLAAARPAPACRLVKVGFRPAVSDLQIVVWIETATGEHVRTVFMTDKTGRYGIGNRPGRFDFNSEWQWPYGRRVTVFPVWAGRSPTTYPKLIFQDEADDNLSHDIYESSNEAYFCRPLHAETDAEKIDTMSCASVVYTDKGTILHVDGRPVVETSKYPPRNDMSVYTAADHPDVMTFGDLNLLDAISQPTPPAGVDHPVYFMADELPDGEYVAWVEVSREFDQNQAYDFPSPTVFYGDYGRAYRGQPSIVWSVPFTIGPDGGVFGVLDYAGYGSPDGSQEGVVNPPDATINLESQRPIVHTAGDGVTVSGEARLWTFAEGRFTEADVGRTLIVDGSLAFDGAHVIRWVESPTTVKTMPGTAQTESFGDGVTARVDTPGSGALRLSVMEDERRLRVTVIPGHDEIPPGAPADVSATSVSGDSARIEFTAPGDDGAGGETLTAYEIRFQVGSPITEENFGTSMPVAPLPAPAEPGTRQAFVMNGLQPDTHYWVGLRALDECLNPGGITIFFFVTTAHGSPAVDSCACRAGGARTGAAGAPLALALALLALGRRRRTK